MGASRAGRPVTARPSAAVTLMRERDAGGIAVFMVRRHVQSDFVPDVFVFPGGSVTPDDIAAEEAPGLCAPVATGLTQLGHGFRVAALRECFEEAGVLLARRGASTLTIAPDEIARFGAYRDGLNARTLGLAEVAGREGLTLATDDLLHWAHWITPERLPRRFDTHFFLAAMPAGQEAAHDQGETTAGVWVSPEEALEGYARGEFPLVFATEHQLRALSGLAGIAAAHERFAGRTPRTIMPRVVEQDGAETIVLADQPEA